MSVKQHVPALRRVCRWEIMRQTSCYSGFHLLIKVILSLVFHFHMCRCKATKYTGKIKVHSGKINFLGGGLTCFNPTFHCKWSYDFRNQTILGKDVTILQESAKNKFRLVNMLIDVEHKKLFCHGLWLNLVKFRADYISSCRLAVRVCASVSLQVCLCVCVAYWLRAVLWI